MNNSLNDTLKTLEADISLDIALIKHWAAVCGGIGLLLFSKGICTSEELVACIDAAKAQTDKEIDKKLAEMEKSVSL